MDPVVIHLEEKKEEQQHSIIGSIRSVNSNQESKESKESKMECDDDLVNEIVQKHLYPNYIDMISVGLHDMRYWQYTSTAFCTISAIVMSVSTILSFSAPQFTNVNFVSYLAGCFGVAAICCDRFSHYCDGKSSFSLKKVNILLKSLGIKYKLPDISVLSIGDANNNQTNIMPNVIQSGTVISKN